MPRRRRWFGIADQVVAASHYAARLLADDFAVPADKITVIQNGVDLKAFHPQPVPPSFLQQHGLEGRRVVLTVTRLVPRKGVDKVLEALPRIAGKFPDLLYLVVGDGPQHATLEARAQMLGITHLVRFMGAVGHSATSDFYNAAELVVMPNREDAGEADGLPLVFLEANACAKPVIGGKAGGTPEILRDGENGILVDGGDAGAIEIALDRLLSDERLRTRMGQKALQMAQSWDWSERTKAFLNVCRR
jgi:phosphatidylinositol alpha-1,6-mannosyltransferase